jgi:paraquat-inducible protein A
MTRLVIVVLTLVNFALLIPGVTLPIYSVEITTVVEAAIIADPVEVTVYQQTRSILSTVRELWRSADYLVSFLILAFSVIVPVTKGSMLLASIYVRKGTVKKWLVLLVDLIGKWSMADVFVVGVFLAFLATRDQVQENLFTVPILLRQVEIGMETHLTSTLGPGFYYFLGYCLFSIFSTQVLKHRQSA